MSSLILPLPFYLFMFLAFNTKTFILPSFLIRIVDAEMSFPKINLGDGY